MDTLTLQKATTADCALIHALASIAFPATYQEILSPSQIDYMMEWMYAPANIGKQMEVDGHEYFIAYFNNEACGYLSIEQQEEDLFHLQKIYVLPRFQGKRVGRFLFEKAIEQIKSIHPAPCRMELNVNRQNKAMHFYERMGMRKLNEGDFAIGNGYSMCDFIMGMDV